MIDMVRFFADSGDWAAVVVCVVGLLSVPIHFLGAFLYCWRKHERKL